VLDRFFLEQKRTARHPLPTLTFTDSLTIHLGSREIVAHHVDRAITPGDAFLVLPRENLVVSGDLLINPITFALFCYPDGWIRSLEWIDALDAGTLIPGHGAPLRDENLLHATLALLRREREITRAEKARGRSAGEVKETVLADAEVQKLRATITGGDSARDPAFAVYLVEWFVKRAWAEADGPLDDSIPASP
jgi:glyoxylase-like metal-dependent hydrolase (beta-lactamase superfamily II)